MRVIIWWRARRRMRRIADVEYECGLSANGNWWALVRSEWYTMIDVHLTAPFRILRAAQPVIRGLVKAETEAGTPDVECTDRVWAAIACGDLSASTAAKLGLIRVHDSAALRVLDAFAMGPEVLSS